MEGAWATEGVVKNVSSFLGAATIMESAQNNFN
jgi:hypothetical protein